MCKKNLCVFSKFYVQLFNVVLAALVCWGDHMEALETPPASRFWKPEALARGAGRADPSEGQDGVSSTPLPSVRGVCW